MAEFQFNFDLEGSQVEENGCSTKQEGHHQPIAAVGTEKVSESTALAKEIKVSQFHWSRSLALSLRHVTSLCEYQVPNTTLTLRYINYTNTSNETSTTNPVTHSDIDAHHLEKFSRNGGNGEENEGGTDTRELDELLRLSDSHHSDLIPGVYEGGLKIWECTYDLIQYFVESNLDFSGLKVLELGCGVGLPAIYALMKGASELCFQDYNSEVINNVTIPSVLLNIGGIENANGSLSMSGSQPECGNDSVAKCKFYSGDWTHFADLITRTSHGQYYDVILTSETIYSETSQPKLLSAIQRLLKPRNGVALVAAKSYYFGVGGSVCAFEELVKRDGYFSLREVKTIDCSVPRKILQLVPLGGPKEQI